MFENKAQTIVEFLLIISISLILMLVVYSLFASQINSNAVTSEIIVARSMVAKMVDAANTAQLSGVGSTIKLELDFPINVDLENSFISGNTILLRLFNNIDVIGITDVNLDGQLRNVIGKQTIFFVYDGTKTSLEYLDFELNKQNINIFSEPNKKINEQLSIRNNSNKTISISMNDFFSNDFVETNFENNFILGPFEIKTINLEFNINETAQGNHSGFFEIIGTINNYNSLKKLFIGIELI